MAATQTITTTCSECGDAVAFTDRDLREWDSLYSIPKALLRGGDRAKIVAWITEQNAGCREPGALGLCRKVACQSAAGGEA